MIKRVIICLVLSLASCLCSAETTPLTLEDLIKIRSPVSMEMSPDGEFVAYTLTKPRRLFVDDDGENWREMYLLSRKGNIIPFLTGGEAIGQIHWSSDSQTIWFLAKRHTNNHVGIYAISVNGGEARCVVQHETDIRGFDLGEDNESLIYWAKEKSSKNQKQARQWGLTAQVFDEDNSINTLWYINFDNGQSSPKQINIPGHVIDAQLSPDNQQLLIRTSPSANKDAIVMNKSLILTDLSGKPVTQFSHKGKMGKAVFSPDGKHIAMIGANIDHLPAEGRLLVATSNAPELVSLLPDLEGQVKDIGWLSNKTLGFIVHQGTRSFLASKRINSPVQKLSGNLKKLSSPKAILREMSLSEDGEHIAFKADAPDHPREIYWYFNKRINRYTDSNKWLEEKSLGKQQVMRFSARDGLELEGILVTPLKKNSDPLPLLIFVHGGPEVHFSNGWLERYSNPAHIAAGKGYASFFPNYRGSTARGVAFSQMGQADYAGREFDDLLDARQFLIEQGIADPKRVGISGASYGGYAASWAATKHTELFAASVSGMGISNQLSKFGTTDIPTEMYRLHSLSWPWEKWHWMLERSPIYFSNQSKTPLLMLHGKLDPRVHYSQSMELYRYLKQHGNAPVRLVLYPNEGHGFRRSAAKWDYSSRLLRWMDHFLIKQHTGLPAMELTVPTSDSQN